MTFKIEYCVGCGVPSNFEFTAQAVDEEDPDESEESSVHEHAWPDNADELLNATDNPSGRPWWLQSQTCPGCGNTAAMCTQCKQPVPPPNRDDDVWDPKGRKWEESLVGGFVPQKEQAPPMGMEDLPKRKKDIPSNVVYHLTVSDPESITDESMSTHRHVYQDRNEAQKAHQRALDAGFKAELQPVQSLTGRGLEKGLSSPAGGSPTRIPGGGVPPVLDTGQQRQKPPTKKKTSSCEDDWCPLYEDPDYFLGRKKSQGFTKEQAASLAQCEYCESESISSFMGRQVCQDHLTSKLEQSKENISLTQEGIRNTTGPSRLKYEILLQDTRNEVDKGKKKLVEEDVNDQLRELDKAAHVSNRLINKGDPRFNPEEALPAGAYSESPTIWDWDEDPLEFNECIACRRHIFPEQVNKNNKQLHAQCKTNSKQASNDIDFDSWNKEWISTNPRDLGFKGPANLCVNCTKWVGKVGNTWLHYYENDEEACNNPDPGSKTSSYPCRNCGHKVASLDEHVCDWCNEDHTRRPYYAAMSDDRCDICGQAVDEKDAVFLEEGGTTVIRHRNPAMCAMVSDYKDTILDQDPVALEEYNPIVSLSADYPHLPNTGDIGTACPKCGKKMGLDYHYRDRLFRKPKEQMSKSCDSCGYKQPMTLNDENDPRYDAWKQSKDTKEEEEEDDDIDVFRFDHGGQTNENSHPEIHEQEHGAQGLDFSKKPRPGVPSPIVAASLSPEEWTGAALSLGLGVSALKAMRQDHREDKHADPRWKGRICPWCWGDNKSEKESATFSDNPNDPRFPPYLVTCDSCFIDDDTQADCQMCGGNPNMGHTICQNCVEDAKYDGNPEWVQWGDAKDGKCGRCNGTGQIPVQVRFPRISGYDSDLDLEWRDLDDPRGRRPSDFEYGDVENIRRMAEDPNYQKCTDCGGTRYVNQGMDGCGLCGGLGYIEKTSQMRPSPNAAPICPNCGEWKTIADKCASCGTDMSKTAIISSVFYAGTPGDWQIHPNGHAYSLYPGDSKVNSACRNKSIWYGDPDLAPMEDGDDASEMGVSCKKCLLYLDGHRPVDRNDPRFSAVSRCPHDIPTDMRCDYCDPVNPRGKSPVGVSKNEPMGHRGRPTDDEMERASYLRPHLQIALDKLQEQGYNDPKNVLAEFAGMVGDDEDRERWLGKGNSVKTIETILNGGSGKHWSMDLIEKAMKVVHENEPAPKSQETVASLRVSVVCSECGNAGHDAEVHNASKPIHPEQPVESHEALDAYEWDAKK